MSTSEHSEINARVAEHANLIQLLLVPVLFFVGVKLSLALAVMPEVVVMLWLPNGFILAALLRFGLRRYGYFALLILVAEIAADYPTFSFVESLLFGVINLLEATIAYLLLSRWRFDSRFVRPVDLAKFLIAGPVIAAFVTACAAGAIYSYFRGIELTYFEFLRVWWFSDALGLMIVTPLVLSIWPLKSGAVEEPIRLRWFDGLVALLAFAAIAVILVSENGMFYGAQVRPTWLFPLLLYAAARLTPRMTIFVLVIFSTVFLFTVENGQQPFGELPIHETVLQVQQLVFLMTVTSIGFAALLAQLRADTRELEARVQARTAELREANEQLQKWALTDPLTGVLNRRALFDVLRREMERHRRHGHQLAVIMFDIDHFKAVNDTYGHAVGDSVLQHVAQVAAKEIRGTDTLARYGGEEFVLIAPETDKLQAVQLSNRVREALRVGALPMNQGELRITASFGVALMRAQDAAPEEVLQRADEALYAAKAAGRDRVMAEGPLVKSA
jgi:diguanylate cyclase (GGDEF)-like protein